MNIAEFTRRLDPVCTQFAARALTDLGWRPSPGDAVDVDELMTRCTIAPHHRRLIGRILEMLGEDGYLSTSSGGWTVAKALPAANAAASCRELLGAFPSFECDSGSF